MAGDLIEAYVIILNGVYNIPRENFFRYDLAGLRGHDCKLASLFKKDFESIGCEFNGAHGTTPKDF